MSGVGVAESGRGDRGAGVLCHGIAQEGTADCVSSMDGQVDLPVGWWAEPGCGTHDVERIEQENLVRIAMEQGLLIASASLLLTTLLIALTYLSGGSV